MADKEGRLQEQKRRGRKAGPGGLLQKKNKDMPYLETEDGQKIFIMVDETQKMAKGGRAGFKSGSKGCKLAMRGKGRAYGKNS
jgi:hypothetical protein